MLRHEVFLLDQILNNFTEKIYKILLGVILYFKMNILQTFNKIDKLTIEKIDTSQFLK